MTSDPTTTAPLINVRGNRVALGPIMPEHVEMIARFRQDPEVVIFSDGSFRAEAPRAIVQDVEQWIGGGPNFAIFELEQLTMLGTAGLRRVDYRNGTAIFGIQIGRKEDWGKGYGTEATRLVVDYGFRFLNLYNITLDTASFNTRAIRAYQKAGFKETGRRRGSLLIGGKRYDEVLMDCVADDWEPPSPGWFSP